MTSCAATGSGVGAPLGALVAPPGFSTGKGCMMMGVGAGVYLPTGPMIAGIMGMNIYPTLPGAGTAGAAVCAAWTAAWAAARAAACAAACAACVVMAACAACQASAFLAASAAVAVCAACATPSVPGAC